MLAASSRDLHNLAVRAPALNSPALSPADRQRLDELHARLTELRPRNIGYPCNQAYDITELFRFLHFSANNVGDPFISHITVMPHVSTAIIDEFVADFAEVRNREPSSP